MGKWFLVVYCLFAIIELFKTARHISRNKYPRIEMAVKWPLYDWIYFIVTAIFMLWAGVAYSEITAM